MNYPYKGKLSNIPDFVVEEMLNQQQIQGNKRDVTVFENDMFIGRRGGGFTWRETVQGQEFWRRVLREDDFHLFLSHFKPTLLVSQDTTDLPIKAEVIGYIKLDTDCFITIPEGRTFIYICKNAFISTKKIELLKKANELIKQAQELKEQAEKL